MNSSHPAATKTRRDLKAVQEEIARTKEEVERAKWEVSVKEKQIRVVMTSLGDLREVLRDEDWRKRRSDEALSTAAADAKDGEDGGVADDDDDEGNKRTKTSE